MPTPTFRAAAGPLFACLLALTFPALAEAKPRSTAADLRVVDPEGRTLADLTQLTGPARIGTDPRADCFGPGTGGSGDEVAVDGTSALGQLATAGGADRRVRRLGITDAFDFGLGICRIGPAVAPSTGYWYLKVNHAASFTGADQTTVRRGDEILWYLVEDFNDPVPDELDLRAPAAAEAGEPFTVEVTAYDDDGDASPAAGVEVTGADAPTDASGRATVTVGARTRTLRASGAAAITSNGVTVCTEALRDCPPGYARTIGGTPRADRIVAGRGAEKIEAGAGRDRIVARRGRAADLIDCGAGRDRVLFARGSGSRLRSCERVERR
ncbi:MAG: hypothetical protein KJ006_09100 [Thermoleophilia bacterium]|nr:hypothetical protein [Thermoleophilia bacterium]